MATQTQITPPCSSYFHPNLSQMEATILSIAIAMYSSAYFLASAAIATISSRKTQMTATNPKWGNVAKSRSVVHAKIQ